MWPFKKDTSRWIVFGEPSMFRRHETFVEGPIVGWRKARRWARRYCGDNPYASVMICSAAETIMQGDRQIWPEIKPS